MNTPIDLLLQRLTPDHVMRPFDCGDKERRYLKNLRTPETTQTYAMYFDLSVFIDE